MTETLFRQEVIDAQRRSWLGGISLAQPLPLWMLTIGAGLAAVSVILFLLLGSYTRRATVGGHLVPVQGMATVLAPSTGVVIDLSAHEGAQVAGGQTLAVIHVPRSTAGSGETVVALEQRLQRRAQSLDATHASQQQLLAAQSGGLRNQLGNAQRELAQIESEIETRQAQVRIAEDGLARMRQLHGQQYVSTLQVQQQEAAALAQLADVQVLQRQAIATRRMIAQLQQTLRELPGRRLANDAAHQRDRALLEQEQVETEARGALTVTAPVSGVIATQLAKPGQAVQAGQPLLSLLPGDGTLEAELLVPSRAIGFIAPGDTVLLRYQAFPYQKFGHQQGEVARISRSALNQGELQTLVGSAMQVEPMYRVTVQLARQAITAYGQSEALKPGMVLEADVLGERRRLIEWVFEPLYSLKGRVGRG